MRQTWSDQNVKALEHLWASGRTARYIATVLGEGITRNAVIGKVNRLRLRQTRDALPPLTTGGGASQQTKCLLALANGLCTTGDVARVTGIPSGTCSARLIELCQRGMAQRVDGATGRGVLAMYELTEAGVCAYRAAQKRAAA